MELRYPSRPDEIPGMTTDELRRRFLLEDLFAPGTVRSVYSHHDRVVMAGAVPVDGALTLEAPPQLAADRFFDNREAGVVNVGGPGRLVVDDEALDVEKGACVYIGRGARTVTFGSLDAGRPAVFYLFSAPAHTSHPTAKVGADEGTVRELGDAGTSNRRTLRQYIHPGGVRSCQVMMGTTTLHDGSMWNTMPAHLHDRRTECYLYFDIPAEERVIHLMGAPQETRHLVVGDRQAVLSPSWSVHCGFGTASYSFVWAMAGENQAFDDMDPVPVADMR